MRYCNALHDNSGSLGSCDGARADRPRNCRHDIRSLVGARPSLWARLRLEPRPNAGQLKCLFKHRNDRLRHTARQLSFLLGRLDHLRFAQHRALGRKVSDEFIVPLCRGHHREVHQSGDEAACGAKPEATASAPPGRFGPRHTRFGRLPEPLTLISRRPREQRLRIQV